MTPSPHPLASPETLDLAARTAGVSVPEADQMARQVPGCLPGWDRVTAERAAASRRAAEDVVLYDPRRRVWMAQDGRPTYRETHAGVWFRAVAEQLQGGDFEVRDAPIERRSAA